MQLSSTLSLVTLAAIASAASTFDLISIRSGTQFQYLSVIENNDELYLGSGSSVTFQLNDDQTLQDTKSNNYIKVDGSKFTETSDKSSATKGFGVQDGYLTYGNTGFYGCPDGKGGFELTTSCSDSSGSPVALSVTNQKGSSGSSSSAAASSSSSAKPSTLITKTTTSAKASAKATTTTSTKPAATTSAAPQGNTNFGIIAIHSGTQFQNAPIKKVDSHVHVFSVGGSEGSDVTLTLKPDGTLVDQDGRGIYIDPSTGEFGDVDPWGQEQASSGFSITDGNLVYQGKDNWKACPSGNNQFSLANNDCTGGTGIALSVVNQK